MSTKDSLELRNFMKTKATSDPREREFFTKLDAALRSNNIWPTTTTSSTSTTSTTSSTSTTTSTSSSTTTTTAP